MNLRLKDQDSLIYETLKQEFARQNSVLQLIASENYASKAVMEAQGSVLTNRRILKILSFFSYERKYIFFLNAYHVFLMYIYQSSSPEH